VQGRAVKPIPHDDSRKLSEARTGFENILFMLKFKNGADARKIVTVVSMIF
jgi:hypothetical protein